MQGDWERCGYCGARLPPAETAQQFGPSSPGSGIQPQEPLGDLPFDRTAIINLTLYIMVLMIGIILIGVLCVLVIQVLL